MDEVVISGDTVELRHIEVVRRGNLQDFINNLQTRDVISPIITGRGVSIYTAKTVDGIKHEKALVTFEPQVKPLLYEGRYDGVFDPDVNDPSDLHLRKFDIQLPYIHVLVYRTTRQGLVDQRFLASGGFITSMAPVSVAPLPNAYEDGRICFGSWVPESDIQHGPIGNLAEALYEQYFEQAHNDELNVFRLIMPDYTFKDWEEDTKNNVRFDEIVSKIRINESNYRVDLQGWFRW